MCCAVLAAGILIWWWRYTAHDALPTTTAATVNGVELPIRAVVALAADRPSFERFGAQLVDQEVTAELVRQEAARRGVALTPAEEHELDRRMPPAAVLEAQAAELGLAVAELIAYRRQLLRGQVVLRKLLEQEFAGELTPDDAALRGAFDEAPLAYADPPAVTVRGFLVPLPAEPSVDQLTEAEAQAAHLIAAAKAVDSADAFSRLVADEGATPSGVPDGVLGTLSPADPFSPPPEIPAMLGPALSGEMMRALFPPSSEPGERVVGPFRGPQGVLGLYIEDRRRAGAAPAFEQVRDQVRERWIGRAQMALIPRLMNRLRAAATIELNQGVIAS